VGGTGAAAGGECLLNVLLDGSFELRVLRGCCYVVAWQGVWLSNNN
jgi:hypothetical protein